MRKLQDPKQDGDCKLSNYKVTEDRAAIKGETSVYTPLCDLTVEDGMETSDQCVNCSCMYEREGNDVMMYESINTTSDLKQGTPDTNVII